MPQTCNKSEKTSDRRYAEKVFEIRESYFTTLLEDAHLKSVYHIFVAIFIAILVESISYDFLTYGRVYLGMRTIKKGFGGIHFAFGVWILMHIAMLGLYYALQTWNQVRKSLQDYGALQKIWNCCCIISFVGFQLTILYIGTITCLAKDLPFGSTVALLMETFRLMMKAYAFVRTNIGKVLTEPSTLQNKSIQLAPVSSYLYYLFAPTFIYRDSYPRTKRIRWGFVIKHLLLVVVYIFVSSCIYERHILKNFENFGVKMPTKRELVETFFAMILPGILILFSFGYMLLHCWLNFTSEVLLFGDRVFYKDWWTSPNCEIFFRSWNIVVHEWFYEYVYKDFYKYIFKGSKMCSAMVVFLVSALMHEHVMILALRMFYPVMFVLFEGFGVLFFFATRKLTDNFGKMFFWTGLLFGNTFLYWLCSMEYFARMNTSWVNGDGWMQQLTQTPASWKFLGLTES